MGGQQPADTAAMKVVGAVAFVAAFAFIAPACGGGDQPRQTARLDPGREPSRVKDTHAELPDLARALIPPEAVDQPKEDTFTVEECGIQPVFPCVRAYFVIEGIDLDARLALVRRQARSAGWEVVSEGSDRSVVEVRRDAYFASYLLERNGLLPCEAGSRCIAGTMLTVAAPPTPLPEPSEAERASWSAERNAFVEDANAICAEMQRRMTEPEEITSTLSDGLKELSALKAPAGEENEVDRILRPLRNLARAADALTDDKGEDALPAAVGVGLFARRFNEAASRYGLDTCATLG